MLQRLQNVVQIGSLARQIIDNGAECLFAKTSGRFLQIWRSADVILGCQGVRQIPGFIFDLSDDKDGGVFFLCA